MKLSPFVGLEGKFLTGAGRGGCAGLQMGREPGTVKLIRRENTYTVCERN